MDVNIEATAIVAEAAVVDAVITVITTIINKAIVLTEHVATFARLSIGGVSLSAVSPDNYFLGGLAKAA